LKTKYSNLKISPNSTRKPCGLKLIHQNILWKNLTDLLKKSKNNVIFQNKFKKNNLNENFLSFIFDWTILRSLVDIGGSELKE
jgi:hypothetical protein